MAIFFEGVVGMLFTLKIRVLKKLYTNHEILAQI